MVFKLKELIYTGIFILLGLLLIIFLVKMFKSDKKETPKVTTQHSEISSESDTIIESEEISSTAPAKKNPRNKYSPGIYTSSLILNNSALEIEVCVSVNSIDSISIKNMDEVISTMYPLMNNSISDLENQILNSQSLDNITYSAENRYTYMVLLDTISHALSKAEINN